MYIVVYAFDSVAHRCIMSFHVSADMLFCAEYYIQCWYHALFV